jgi:hypothetical protein
MIYSVSFVAETALPNNLNNYCVFEHYTLSCILSNTTFWRSDSVSIFKQEPTQLGILGFSSPQNLRSRFLSCPRQVHVLQVGPPS